MAACSVSAVTPSGMSMQARNSGQNDSAFAWPESLVAMAVMPRFMPAMNWSGAMPMRAT